MTGRRPPSRTALVLLAGALVAALGGCGDAGTTPAAGQSAGGTPVAAPACPPVPRPAAPVRGLPATTLPCLGPGDEVRLSDLAGPAVLTGWASWCGPCRTELPAFERLGGAVPGVAVWGVVTDDRADAAAALAGEMGLTFPSLYDADGSLRRALGVPGIPFTVLVGADGTVTHVHTGPPLDDEALRALVAEHLGVGTPGGTGGGAAGGSS